MLQTAQCNPKLASEQPLNQVTIDQLWSISDEDSGICTCPLYLFQFFIHVRFGRIVTEDQLSGNFRVFQCQAAASCFAHIACSVVQVDIRNVNAIREIRFSFNSPPIL